MAVLLAVDDNSTNLDLITRRLQRYGYKVISAQSGREALDLARTEQPDLILMDLSMPDMDGWEATRLLKDDQATAAIPVIAVTAHAYKTDVQRALAAGCDQYEVKPIDFERLGQKIESLLHRPGSQ